MAKSETAKPKTAATRKPRAAASAAPAAEPSKVKFARAIDEARAGAQALGKEAQDKAGAYRDKLAGQSSEWLDEAKVVGSQAKERAAELANEGKVRASEAIFNFGKIVEDNAAAIDEKVGAKYGDYARTAAQKMQETAAKIEAKDLGELGDDAREMVRKSPAVAVGLAALAGFMLSRLFRSK